MSSKRVAREIYQDKLKNFLSMYSRKKEQQCVYKPLERSYVPDLNKLAYLEAPHEQLRLTVAKLEKEFFENGMSNLSDSFESLDRKSPEKQLNESSVAGALRQSESMKSISRTYSRQRERNSAKKPKNSNYSPKASFTD